MSTRTWAALAIIACGWGCASDPPPRGPEKSCARSCAAAARQCTEIACSRGCNLVLDRLVEQEGDTVITCVAHSAPRCDDRVWAGCAARIGPHADGGPPAPPPPSDDVDEGSGS